VIHKKILLFPVPPLADQREHVIGAGDPAPRDAVVVCQVAPPEFEAGHDLTGLRRPDPLYREEFFIRRTAAVILQVACNFAGDLRDIPPLHAPPEEEGDQFDIREGFRSAGGQFLARTIVVWEIAHLLHAYPA
jgi:hypothetical protein